MDAPMTDSMVLANVSGFQDNATPEEIGHVFYSIENQIRLRVGRMESDLWDIGVMLVACEWQWPRIVSATRLTVDFDSWAANVTGKNKRIYRNWMSQASYFFAGEGAPLLDAVGGFDEFRKSVPIGKATIAAAHHRAGKEVDVDALADENVTEAQFFAIQNGHGEQSGNKHVLCRDSKIGVIFLVADGEPPVVLFNYEVPDIPFARAALSEVMRVLRHSFGMVEGRFPPPPPPPASGQESPEPVAERG